MRRAWQLLADQVAAEAFGQGVFRRQDQGDGHVPTGQSLLGWAGFKSQMCQVVVVVVVVVLMAHTYIITTVTTTTMIRTITITTTTTHPDGGTVLVVVTCHHNRAPPHHACINHYHINTT